MIAELLKNLGLLLLWFIGLSIVTILTLLFVTELWFSIERFADWIERRKK